MSATLQELCNSNIHSLHFIFGLASFEFPNTCPPLLLLRLLIQRHRTDEGTFVTFQRKPLRTLETPLPTRTTAAAPPLLQRSQCMQCGGQQRISSTEIILCSCQQSRSGQDSLLPFSRDLGEDLFSPPSRYSTRTFTRYF
jgi:hypothetical protein